MFWADHIVNEVIEKKTTSFDVYDWWTPSGLAHAGHVRTFLLHQAIYRGLQMKGKDTTYFYGFDDMDPLDGMPPDLPQDYEQYMGMPLYKVPSYKEGFDNLGAYYAAEYLHAMEILDIHPEVPTTSKMYLAGDFNPAIKIALDKAETVRAVYKDLGAERPDDWYAFQTVCEQCGKIGTTRVFAWDGEQVTYKCEPNLVKWAQGCGYEGKISPYNGNGKMPWKVEWAAKWYLLNYAYEGGGKDHFTKNGSRDYARRMIRDVFESEEPIGYPHEFFLVGGKKQASSKGLGLSAVAAVQLLPPQLMRYFVFRVDPKKQIEFTLEGDAIPRIYDDYDKALNLAQTDPESNEARALVYAHQSDAELPEYTLRFTKLAFLTQMPHVDILAMAEQDKGAPLTEADKAELLERTEYAKQWLAKHADESFKFTLQETLPVVELTDEQKQYLVQIADALNTVEWTGGSLHTILHSTKEALGLSPRDAFSALYRIFLNKDQGPQAGWFLAALDKDFVLKRLQEAVA